MPLPTPRGGEKRNEFVGRCMSNDTAQRDFPNNNQRIAVCISQWNRAKKGENEVETEDQRSNVDWSVAGFFTALAAYTRGGRAKRKRKPRS